MSAFDGPAPRVTAQMSTFEFSAESSTSLEVSKTKMLLIGPKVILRCQLLIGPRPESTAEKSFSGQDQDPETQ